MDLIRDYWTQPKPKQTLWTLTIDDEGVLTFPDELLEGLDWKEGDDLEWIDKGDGSFELRKVDDLQSPG